MQTQKKIKIETFLKHPDVQEVIRNVNQDLIERREYKPPVCGIFLQARVFA